jgi:peptidoglycan/LPS O-acetylase OafA/YrhL
MDRRDNNFDLFRLLAAWLVLFSHSYPIAGQPMADPFTRYVGIDTFGGVGVAIFFVLSGYLVTKSWQRSTSVFSFVWKRIRRIYPALVVCVLISTVVVGPLLTTLDLAAYATHDQTIDYLFTATAWDIHYVLPGLFWNNMHRHIFNGSLWSLPYEMACYAALVAAGLLPLAMRWKVLIVTVILAFMLLARPVSPPAAPLDVVFGLDYYMVKLGLCFAVGAAYQCWASLIKPAWWIGAIGVVIAWMLPDSAPRNLFWIFSFSTLSLGIALGVSWLPKLPSAMGDWSYGLYLYAFPVQQILSYYGIVKSLGFVGYTALCTALALICAALSWFVVERPALRTNWPLVPRGRRPMTKAANGSAARE